MLGSKNLKLSFLLFAGLLSGCAVIDHHGHELTPEDLKVIQVGKTTRDQVGKRFGTPSAVSPFGNGTWLYMSKTTSRRAFLTPSVLRSSVTRIEFDKKSVVQGLTSLTEADERIISHVNRRTPTAGYEFGAVDQIFSNVGKFNGQDPDMDRGGPGGP